jgi:hypothetical protein
LSTDTSHQEEADVCNHSTTGHSHRPLPDNRSCPANALDHQQRQRLALDALAGTQPLSHRADEHDVSRKFVYQQAGKAQQALDRAFSPKANGGDQQVLFTLPVTKSLLRQIVLGLILICHSSFRGVVEFLNDLFDFRLSVGTVANIVHSAVDSARAHNERQDLSAVAIGAHDEIFQTQEPVLVGVCAHSSYCYLLSQEQHRDADTWGVRLLELKERGFAPTATIADFASGLRAGQEAALPKVPCRGDVFHAVYELQKVVGYLERRAYAALEARLDLQRQRATPGKRRDRLKYSLGQRLRQARLAEAQALALYDDIALLQSWLQNDILSVNGPDYATRVALYDFVVAELQVREALGPKGIKEVRTLLQNQRQPLLAFATALTESLTAVAAGWEVPLAVVQELLQVQALPRSNPCRWQREAALRRQLRGRYYGLSRVVAAVAADVVRASSVVENLNSRLRGYFFLRRQLGSGYLSLLQFFLNHRRYQRSEHAERVGQSPRELLTGQTHPHWLELLGYQRFRCN